MDFLLAEVVNATAPPIMVTKAVTMASGYKPGGRLYFVS